MSKSFKKVRTKEKKPNINHKKERKIFKDVIKKSIVNNKIHEI